MLPADHGTRDFGRGPSVVSVVIPTYNSARLVSATLASVFAQEIPRWVKPEWLSEPQDASNTAVLVARRNAFQRAGLFDPSYESGEDTEWLLRARQAGVVIERLPEVIVRKRLHGGNLSVEAFDRRKETLARIARESIRRRRESGS
jgi:GT2 family glycosyltransferase